MPDDEASLTRRMSIIRNPIARGAPSDAALAGPLEALRRSGWAATVEDTTAPGDATAMSRAAASDGVDAIVVCGGDGSLNEAANGLVGTETALALIPSGTANVWAREMGISSDPTAALGLLEAGRRVRVDTGVVQIGDGEARHFLLMCSAGLDAEVVRAVEGHPRLKRRLGRAAFGWPALRALATLAAVETTIGLDDAESTGPLLMALAGNTRLYGSVARLADEALIDDGLLDLVTFEDVRGRIGRRTAHRARLVARALRGHLRSSRTPGIRYSRVSRIRLDVRAPMPVQADGELIGYAGPEAPLQVRTRPRSLTVIVPVGVNPLFSRASDS